MTASHINSHYSFDPMPAIRLWNAGSKRRPLYMDQEARLAKKKAEVSLNKEICEATPDEPVVNVEVVEEVNVLNCDSKPIDDGYDSDTDYYSSDEEYSSEGRVFQTMCREGLFEE